METSADRIRSVVKNLLPERPHHLSLYPDRKYPVPPNYWHHQSPLQYSTFVSDADRGVLLTRPYFDICDEPDPNPVTSQPAARTGPKKTLNKMSFKDYKKQKEKASTSPTENGVPGKLEDRKSHTSMAVKIEKESPRKELDRPRDSAYQRESKAQDSRTNGDLDRYAHLSRRDRNVDDANSHILCRSKSTASKHPPRDAPSPSESKKRPLDPEDSVRPNKKAKSNEEPSRKAARPDTPRSREQNSLHDRSMGRDGRSGAVQPPPSSRAALGSARERDRAASPKITVNGVRTQGNSLPRKPDASGKHLVPPLLSPLRHPAIDDELAPISPRKRPKESASNSKAQGREKAARPEVVVKKPKSAAPELPELLSPTLPPMVVEELERLEKVLSKGDSSQPYEPVKAARKTQSREHAEDESRPKSLMVTLRIKKSIRPRVRGLLALPSKNSKERSASMENTPPPAKKRPRAADPVIEAAPAIPARRNKMSEAPASKAPYTPPNPPAPISQVPSIGSQNPTPKERERERVPPTPSAGEGLPPSRGGPSKDHLHRRYGTMMALGRTLKRERDRERQERQKERHKQPNGAGAHAEPPTAEDLRPVMLTMEMILAFFIAFRSFDQASELSRAHVDDKLWLSLELHLKELRMMTTHSLPLYTLATQLSGIFTNEILRVYSTWPREARLEDDKVKTLLRFLKSQFSTWAEADKLRGELTDERLKTPVMGPWTSAYKAAADALAVMGRITEREHVNWRAEVVPPREP